MTPQAGRFLKHAWSVVCWIVLSGLVAGLIAALYYYQRIDKELHRVLQAKLNQAYPHLQVRLGSARIVPNEGIQLGQISFVQPLANQRDGRSEMAYVESLMLRCDATIQALVQERLNIRHIILRGLSVHAQRSADGQLNLESLVPQWIPPCRQRDLPQISIEQGSIRAYDTADGPDRSLAAEDVEILIRLKRLTPAPLDASATDGPVELPQVLLAFDGSFRTPVCRRVTFEGAARSTDGAWALHGQLQGLNFSHDLSRQLPSQLAAHLEPISGLRGRSDLRFHVAKKSRQSPLDYHLEGKFSEGSWIGAGVPQSIADLRFEFAADESGLRIQKLQADYGTGRLRGSLSSDGFNAMAPHRLELTLDRFPISRRFAESLPDHLYQVWAKYEAIGEISGSVSADFDGLQYQLAANLECHDVAFRHEKFPYPVTHGNGPITFDGKVLKVDLGASAGGTPIQVDAEIAHPGPNFTGWWQVATTEWKVIDTELIESLPDKTAQLLRELNLRGNAGFFVRFERDVPQGKPTSEIAVVIDQGWINYEKFPYSISNIHGRLEAVNGQWQFMGLKGFNDGCLIRCDGSWRSQDAGRPLRLAFDLENVELDAGLKQALPSHSQKLWEQLRPQGYLQHVQVDLFKTDDLDRPEFQIHIAHGQKAESAETDDGLQLHPVWFPLRLSRVYGEADVRGNTIILRDMTAEHGKIRMRSNAIGRLSPTGQWEFNLTNFAADQVTLEDPLMQAIPARLAATLHRLQVSGTFALNGALQFARVGADDPVTTRWDLNIDIDQGRMQTGFPVEHIFGQVGVRGGSRADSFWAYGDLRIDSLVSQRIQATQIEGPFSLDNTRVQFGQRVTPRVAGQRRSAVTASLYGGRASGSAEVLLDQDRPFSVQANVTNADMSLVARDWQLGQGNLSGNVMFELFLSGNMQGRHTLRGNGTAQLANANLYELPLILALMNRLGSGRSNNAAFTNSDIAFHLSDGYVYFDRLDLTGDALTLKGLGEMSLNREINLNFYSMIGREQRWNPLVRPFLGEASRQVLQIHVDGTLANPRTSQEVLPGLNGTLKQLFPEQSTDVTSPSLSNRLPHPSSLIPSFR